MAAEGRPQNLITDLENMARRHPGASVAGSFLAGAVPFSNIAARLWTGQDLRRVGSGTVSGTALHRVGGFGPLAVAGVCEVAKGALGPALTRDRPALRAATSGAAVTGHNWSPFIGFAGGRGISPAMGALAVSGWEGPALLGAGLGIGRLARQTGLGSLVAQVSLMGLLGARRGRPGLQAGVAVAAPMITKRLVGNGVPARPRPRHLWTQRLLFDRDPG